MFGPGTPSPHSRIEQQAGRRDMDDAYEMYCLTDPLFYDSFVLRNAADHDFELAQGPVPEGWERAVSGDWLMYVPQDAAIPAQGWKIHASACVNNATEVL